MLAVYSPTTMAPRRGGMLLLAALSLVGVVARVAVLLVEGQLRGFLTYGYWPPPLSYTNPFTRSMPYLAGMWACIVIDQRKQEERLVGAICQKGASPATATAPASCAAADGDSKDSLVQQAQAPQMDLSHIELHSTPTSRPEGMSSSSGSEDMATVIISSDKAHMAPTPLGTKASMDKGSPCSYGHNTSCASLAIAVQPDMTSAPPLGCWASLQQRLCSLAAHRWSVRTVDLVCLAVTVGLTFVGAGANGAPQPHPTSFALAAPIWAAMLQLCTQCILCIR